MSSLAMLFMFIPLLLIPFANKISYKRIRQLFFASSIFLAVLAYNFTPTQSMDLHKLFSVLDETRAGGMEYLTEYSDYSSLPVASGLFYAIAAFGDNHILPAIACFIYYYVITRTIIGYSEVKKKNKIGTLVSIFFFYCINNLLGVMSEVRNPLAISVFCLLIYHDVMDEDKKLYKYLIGYILLCLLHPSMIVLLIIRLLMLINKKYDKILCVLLLSWTVAKTIIADIVGMFSGSAFAELLLEKLTAYDEKEAMSVANVGLYTAVYASIYAIVYCLYWILKKKIKADKNDVVKYMGNIRVFSFVFCFFLGSIFEYHLFIRFSRLIVFLGAFVLVDLLSMENNKWKKITYIMVAIIEALFFLLFYFNGQYLVFNQ